ADRLALGIDQHRGIAVETDQAAVGTAHTLGGADHHGLEHFTLLHAAARNGFLDRHHDDVADIGVAAVRTAQHLDAHHALGAGIVGDIEFSGHLDHDFDSLSRRLLADAFQHLPALELGKWPAFLNANDITDLEFALFVMGVIFLRPANGLAQHGMGEAALHLDHHGLGILVADDGALKNSLRHGLNPWPGQRGAAR